VSHSTTFIGRVQKDTGKLLVQAKPLISISYLFQKVKSRKLLMAGVESRLLLPFSE
jgi:hypothetical protein